MPLGRAGGVMRRDGHSSRGPVEPCRMESSAPAIPFWRKLLFLPRENSSEPLASWVKVVNWSAAFALLALFFTFTFWQLQQGEWLWCSIR